MQVFNLRIEIRDFPINDYRLNEGDIEFRILSPSGHPYPDSGSTGRRLTLNEIVLHFRLNTIVSQWFTDKITGAQREECQRESADVA